MKKRAAAFILSLILLVFTAIPALAGEIVENDEERYFIVDGYSHAYDELNENYKELLDEPEFLELMEELFENPKFSGLVFTAVGALFLFLPMLVIMIVFIVLNVKAKSRLQDYKIKDFFSKIDPGFLNNLNEDGTLKNPNVKREWYADAFPEGEFYVPEPRGIWIERAAARAAAEKEAKEKAAAEGAENTANAENTENTENTENVENVEKTAEKASELNTAEVSPESATENEGGNENA